MSWVQSDPSTDHWSSPDTGVTTEFTLVTFESFFTEQAHARHAFTLTFFVSKILLCSLLANKGKYMQNATKLVCLVKGTAKPSF